MTVIGAARQSPAGIGLSRGARQPRASAAWVWPLVARLEGDPHSWRELAGIESELAAGAARFGVSIQEFEEYVLCGELP